MPTITGALRGRHNVNQNCVARAASHVWSNALTGKDEAHITWVAQGPFTHFALTEVIWARPLLFDYFWA